MTGVRCVAAGEDKIGAGLWRAARGHLLSFDVGGRVTGTDWLLSFCVRHWATAAAETCHSSPVES